jgi:hypothetical protein
MLENSAYISKPANLHRLFLTRQSAGSASVSPTTYRSNVYEIVSGVDGTLSCPTRHSHLGDNFSPEIVLSLFAHLDQDTKCVCGEHAL